MPMPEQPAAMSASSQVLADPGMDMASLMQAPVEPKTSGTLLAVTPDARFLLRHHPTGWGVDKVVIDGKEQACWLPEIVKCGIVPGVGLMRTLRQGEDPDDTWKRSMQRGQGKGWIYFDHRAEIPTKLLPKGVPAGPYIRAVDCRCPHTGVLGKVHLEAWNVPRPPIPGRAQGFAFDRASYNLWRLFLVTSGAVPAPSPEIMDEGTRARATRIRRIEVLPIPDQARAVRVKDVTDTWKTWKGAVVPARAA